MPPRSSTRLLLFAVGLTVILRGLAMWLSPNSFQEDPDAYREIAKTIAESGDFGLTRPDGQTKSIAFRPPLYPWLISWGVFDGELSRVAVGCFHLVLAALTSCCVFLTTRCMAPQVGQTCRGDQLGLIAVVMIAIDPILLRQSNEVMTETLATTLTTAVIWLWCKWDTRRTSGSVGSADSLLFPAGLGGLLALAYLCRPTFLVWAVLLVAATLCKKQVRRRVLSASLMALLVMIAVGGWTVRNHRQFGHPIWATTHGGYTLLLANNDSFYRYLLGEPSTQTSFWDAWHADGFLNAYQHRYEGDPRTASFWQQEWTGEPNYDGSISEYDDDRLCYEAAVATIKRQPGVFIWSAFVRVARLWSPFPHDVSGRSTIAVLAVACFYIAIYVAALTTIFRQRRIVWGQRWWAVWLLAFTLTGVHAVYWSNLRMRAPVIPAIAIMAVFCMTPRHAACQITSTKRE